MALFQRFQRNDQLIHIVRDQPVAMSDEGGFISLIIGLGNVGSQYKETRHNVGFMAVDALKKEKGFPAWQKKAKFKAQITEEFIGGKKIILAKPTTFMNLSGDTVRALKDFYKLKNSDITIIHDELDLPFGAIKEKTSGGSAGHNGLKSIISHIGEDFHRIRIGIKNDQLDKMDSADFVLARFSKSEEKDLKQVIKVATKKLA